MIARRATIRTGERKMRILATGAVVALLVTSIAPAYAQFANAPEEDALKKAQREDAEKAYQRALKDRGSDAATTKTDPWGSVRTTDQQSKSPQSTK
jgi:hypothetical protein